MIRATREHENARDEQAREDAQQLRRDHVNLGVHTIELPTPAWNDADLEAARQRGEEMRREFRRECDALWEAGAESRREHEAQCAEREQFNETISDEREG